MQWADTRAKNWLKYNWFSMYTKHCTYLKSYTQNLHWGEILYTKQVQMQQQSQITYTNERKVKESELCAVCFL